MVSKILIADDEAEILKILERRLVQEGYEVVMATNGQEALEKARVEKPNLILIDVDMPKMDGPEAVKALKNDPNTSSIPVVFITGMISPDDETEGPPGITIDGVFYETMTKPFNFDEVLLKVKSEVWERLY